MGAAAAAAAFVMGSEGDKIWRAECSHPPTPPGREKDVFAMSETQ